METNVEKDLNNDSCSSSGDKDEFLILSQEEVALQNAKLEALEEKLTEALAKIDALEQGTKDGNDEKESDSQRAKLEASQSNEKVLKEKLAKALAKVKDLEKEVKSMTTYNLIKLRCTIKNVQSIILNEAAI